MLASELSEATILELFPQHKRMAMGEDVVKSKTGDATWIESTLNSKAIIAYENARGQCADEMRDWDMFAKMYFGEYVPEGDDSPFKKYNIPRLARLIDLAVANTNAMTIPDKHKLDFFRCVPQVKTDTQQMDPMAAEYARLAEMAVRNDLVKMRFQESFLMHLWDFWVLGNMVALECYDQQIKYTYRREPNPVYNAALPPQYNVRIDEQGNTRPIPKTRVVCNPVKEYDAPRSRYLNPFNVFPDEIDKHNIADCTGVTIYDTTTLGDLEDDEIQTDPVTGETFGIYANLDKLGIKDENGTTPEIDRSAASSGVTQEYGTTQGVDTHGRLKRITRFVKLDRKQQFGDVEPSPEAWTEFCLKFNIDQEKAEYWQTWIIEIINDRVMIRCQPLPYMEDRIPVVHHKLWGRPNRTWGHGIYKRCHYDERIYNFFNRMAIEWTVRQVAPPIGINEQAMNPIWWQLQNGKFRYTRDMIVPLNGNHKINDALQVMQFPGGQIDAMQKQMLDRERTMDMESHMPAVRQGVESGGNTATEVGAMNNNAQVIMMEIAQQVEVGFLSKIVSWMFKLHNQYSEDTRIVSQIDDAGELASFQVPPEVWLNEYNINIIGLSSFTNKAVQAMNIKEFATAYANRPNLNWDELMKEHARTLDMRDPDRFIIPMDQIQMAAEQMLMEQAAAAGVAPGGGDDPNRSHHAPGEVERRQRGLHDEVGVTNSAAQQSRNPANSRAAQA